LYEESKEGREEGQEGVEEEGRQEDLEEALNVSSANRRKAVLLLGKYFSRKKIRDTFVRGLWRTGRARSSRRRNGS
jgi:hypothetical protein